ncbi:MAG: hypothetical protein RJA07_1810 [Bacteroidota bacterium]|jgi:uncharacterized protein (TIRG00374 family)
MNKTAKSVIQFSAFLILGIGIVWFIFHNMSDEQIAQCKNALLNANPFLIILAFCCGLMAHFIRALRWKILMEPMGYKSTVANTYAAVLIGYLANLAFPRLGEVSRCGVLTKYENIPFEKSFGTVIAERIFDMACWLFLVAITVLIEFDRMYAYFKTTIVDSAVAKFQNAGNMKWIIIAVLMIGAVVGIMIIKKIISKNNKIKGFVEGLVSGLKAILNLKRKGIFIFYTILIWSTYLLTQYLGLLCVKETSHLNIFAALSCMTLGSFGFILPTQGGLGGYHAIIPQVLKLYNIPEGIGLASAWVNWGVGQIAIIIGGFLSFLFLPIINKNKKHEHI